MSLADKMAPKLETGERQPAGAAAGSDNRLDERLRLAFKDFQRPSPQPKPGGDLHEVMAGIGRHLHNESLALKTIYDRLLAIESQAKQRGSGGFARYLLAVCIGVAVALTWQSYGETAKQMLAAKAPELGWSPEARQMIANSVEQLGWTKPPTDAERTAVHPSGPLAQVATAAQTVPAAAVPKAPTPPVDPEQVHQIAVDLAALEQTVSQLAASQDQIGRNIDRLQGAVAEILVKMPEPPPPLPVAAPARKPKPTTLPSSRAPTAPPASRAPLPLR
jgi:hypothetical protein